MAAGLLLLVAGENLILLSTGALLLGFGYGVVQPIVYDKAADSVVNPKKETLALSLVLAVNYFSITIAPFMMDLFQKIVGNESNRFPFVFNFVLMLLFAIIVWLNRKKFAFRMNEAYF